MGTEALFRNLQGAEGPGPEQGDRKRSGPVLPQISNRSIGLPNYGARTMAATSQPSDWAALAALTERLYELHGQLEEAEAENKITAIYALEEAIATAEAEREQLVGRLQDRLSEETAA